MSLFAWVLATLLLAFEPTIGPVQPPQETVIAAAVEPVSELRTIQLDELLRAEGSPEEWIEPLIAISHCEDPQGDPAAKGDSGNSIGLWQLWYGWAGTGEDLTEPATNARVAIRVRSIRGRFGGAGGWTCADLLGIP